MVVNTIKEINQSNEQSNGNGEKLLCDRMLRKGLFK